MHSPQYGTGSILVVSFRSNSTDFTATTRPEMPTKAPVSRMMEESLVCAYILNFYDGSSTSVLRYFRDLLSWYDRRLGNASSVFVNCSQRVLCSSKSSRNYTFYVGSFSKVSWWSAHQFLNIFWTADYTPSASTALRPFPAQTNPHVKVLDQSCWASIFGKRAPYLTLCTSLSRLAMFSSV